MPNAAVPEAWCSNLLATNPASGVQVSEFGLPENSTLLTVSTSPDIWYDDALFFLGGGFGGVLSYFSGENANKTNFLHDRTVPIAVRPINAASSPPNTWLTSMMISPAAFPNSGPLDFPAPTFPNVSLEVLGLHTLATLTFEAEPRDPTSLLLPPYFTDFLTCNSKLAAGLPAGWELDATSTWTPSWFYFQARDFNATLTLQCAAEVVPARLSMAMQQLLSPVQDAPTRRTKTLPLYPAAATTPPKSSSICAVLLDFETVEWGTWAPPHAPAVVAPEVNGGTLGLAALDAGRGVQYLGTSTDSPSFGIQLAGLNVSSGQLTRVGAPNYPAAPPGFPGVGGYYFSVAFDESLGGLLVGLTEICKYGLLPPENGGWTVIAAVDPVTGASTALTGNLTAALAPLPPVQWGLGALDPGAAVMWLVVDGGPALPPQLSRHARKSSHSNTSLRAHRRVVRDGVPALVGVPLSSSPSAPTTGSLNVIPTEGGGFQVFSVAFASAVDALVTAECVVGRAGAPCEVHVNAYPVNGSAPFVLGVVSKGQVSPSPGQVTVSADGRIVTFGAVQSEATDESPALITVDVLARTASLTLSAPDDEYDILVLSQCL